MRKTQIWIQCEDKRIQLPINPEEFSVSFDTGASTQKVQRLGDISMIGKRGCRYVSWESIWPAKNYPFAMCKAALTPAEFRSFILRNEYKIIRLTVTGTSLKATKFIVQSFRYDDFDADGDMKYSLSLMEYRVPTFTEPTEKNTTTSSNKPSTTTRPVEKKIPKTYTVKTGDNLWNLAKQFYGSGSKQSTIYNANRSIIESTARKYGHASSSHNGVAGWWIFPGTKLVIP